ncbi:MAG TPA: hypothetical protein VFB80_04880, partial [Pirellulaceae bacterium]|nr:hypothetical protein [Pirellulaceae bacterium]
MGLHFAIGRRDGKTLFHQAATANLSSRSNGRRAMPSLPHARPAELGLDEHRLQSAYDRLDE